MIGSSVTCNCHMVALPDDEVAVRYCSRHKPNCSPFDTAYTVLAGPDGVTLWPLCPTCTEPVQAWDMRIRSGDEFYDGRYSWKNPDEVKGFALQPCGHEVAHVAWLSATRGES